MAVVCRVNGLLNPFTARSDGRLSGEQGSNDDAGLRPTAVCGQERMYGYRRADNIDYMCMCRNNTGTHVH